MRVRGLLSRLGLSASPPAPRISILVTSYNQRDFLVEAIESVLGQTLMPHEIIVADDASSDGSQDTIRAYERKFPGLVKGVFGETNGGIPRNRNAGLAAVTGDYVGILDGDDWFLPHKLETQVAALRDSPGATLVYGNFRIVDAQRRLLRMKWTGPQPSGHVFWDVAACKTGLLRTLIVAREAVVDAGLMDERFPYHDGLALTIKLASRCKILYVDDTLLDKRDHPNSESKVMRPEERQRDLVTIYREMLPMMLQQTNREQRAQIFAAWRHVLGPGVALPAMPG